MLKVATAHAGPYEATPNQPLAQYAIAVKMLSGT